MRRVSPFVLTILAGFILLTAGAQTNNEAARQNKTVPVIELTGSGYERGKQHGTLLKNEIASVYAKWKNNIRYYTRRNADSVLSEFYTATNFEPAIRKWTPQLYEEIKGIAAASGQSLRDVLCFQMVDEFWVYMDKTANTQNHHCSGLGVAATKQHPAYVAQNMDLETYMHNFQVLLHLAPTRNEPEQYLLSCAGLVALNGVNAKGIGVCVNTLLELEASTDGLPVACIVRGILSQQKAKDALRFVQTVKHASGQNYIVGTGDSVYNFEASANKVIRFIPANSASPRVYHTNHPMANNDIKPWYRTRQEQLLAGKLPADNSYARLVSIQNRIGAVADVTEDMIKETLRSKDDKRNPVCRPYASNRSAFTFSSVLLTLGQQPSMQLTFASPDESDYQKHLFTFGKK